MKKTNRKKMKKRGPPRTTGPGVQIQVRCQKAFLAAVDKWLEQHKEHGLSRPGAIRHLAEIALQSIG